MSNVFNLNAKLWVLDTADIISHRKKDNANSGMRPTCIRMIRYRPTTTAHTCIFNTLNTSDTPVLAIAVGQYDVTNTSRITDDPAAAAFNGAAVGDWAHIKTSSTGNNLGWFLVTAVDGSKHYIDVEDDTRALTNDTDAEYTIDLYTPEICIKLVAETGDSGAAAIKTEVIDFGPNGRWFVNLALASIDSNECDVYIK